MGGAESVTIPDTDKYNAEEIINNFVIPSGVNTNDLLNSEYDLTGFVNDINRQYTEVLQEYNLNGTTESSYDYGVQRNSASLMVGSWNQHRETYFYEYDGRGSVSEMTGQTGNVGVKYTYSATGLTKIGHTSENDKVIQPYRYNAERMDDIGGAPYFQYLRSRYLNIHSGTFITQDTYLGELTNPLSQNRYLYAHGNPVNCL